MQIQQGTNAMLQTRKKLLPVLLLIANILAACGTGSYQYNGTSQAPGDAVRRCNGQYLPATTVMTSTQSSAQTIFFVSGVHLYALNAGNGTMRWCVRASRASSNL